ncbi:MAG: copper resistance protein NlpE N-terminal domain-containing protein [Ignavibacteriaceae bacterium]|nr:copper resistance protein NlpE N-terminal domain-containing protein [Ignavibacteriaceae bacterium]
MNYLITPIVCFLIFAGCDNDEKQVPAEDYNSTELREENKFTNTYEGILPCADCKGIKIELVLMGDYSTADFTYKMHETYLSTAEGDKTYKSEGRFIILRGDKVNSEAIVYQLDPDKEESLKNFLVVNENEIKLLDKEMNVIISRLNYSLFRKKNSE